MTSNGPFGGKVDDWCPSGYREVVTLEEGLRATVGRERGQNAWVVTLQQGWGDYLDTPLTPGGKATLATAREVHALLAEAAKVHPLTAWPAVN